MISNVGPVDGARGSGDRPQPSRVDGTETVSTGLTEEAKRVLAAPSPIDLKQKVFDMLTGAKDTLAQHGIDSAIIEGPKGLPYLACDALGSDVYAALPMIILKDGRIHTELTIEPCYMPKQGEFDDFDSLPKEAQNALLYGAYIIPDAVAYTRNWNDKTDGVLVIDGSESYSDGSKTIVSFEHEKPGDVNSWAQNIINTPAPKALLRAAANYPF